MDKLLNHFNKYNTTLQSFYINRLLARIIKIGVFSYLFYLLVNIFFDVNYLYTLLMLSGINVLIYGLKKLLTNER